MRLRARVFKKNGTWYTTCACGDHVEPNYGLEAAFEAGEKFYKRYLCSDYLDRKQAYKRCKE